LALAGGNRSEAGRLLGVSRQAVQQMIEQRHQVRAQPSRPTESERR
jgi:DNA-binding transcriptional regulator YdaS (Cro superfamily)